MANTDAGGVARAGRRRQPGSRADRNPLVASLAKLLGPEAVSDEPAACEIYSRDASIMRGRALAVAFPRTSEQVLECVRTCVRHEVPFVARGAGTGLAGGAVPVEGALVISLAAMRRIVSVDAMGRTALVEPGVVNLDLCEAVRHHRLAFAPDPSSQAVSTIGGNVGANAGGPHCFAYGVTSQHVLGVDLVTPEGELVTLGGAAPDEPGIDLRGVVVGSEGTCGVVTSALVRLTPLPPAVRTQLADFVTVDEAVACVVQIVAQGLAPAALEIMDGEMVRATEEFLHAGLPVDAGAVLLAEVDGMPGEVADAAAVVAETARRCGAREIRVAGGEKERELLWAVRKSAFGAIARTAHDYYLHDCVVPRTELGRVVAEVYAIAARHGLTMMNVFHAGDGNIHPLIVYDRRISGVFEHVLEAGEEIVRTCLDVGGSLSGEHGIGIEKRQMMPWMFGDAELAAMAAVGEAFDPRGLANPAKILPAGSRCAERVAAPGGAFAKRVWV